MAVSPTGFHLNFQSAVFPSPVDFNGRHFRGEVDFTRAVFYEVANFGSARFAGDAHFREARFASTGAFTSATFERGAYFSRATFEGEAKFARSVYRAIGMFREMVFESNCDFESAEFQGAANFHHTVVRGRASFPRAIFRVGAGFVTSVFASRVDFTRTSFEGDVTFRSCALQEHAYFSRAEFSQRASFEDAAFGRLVSFHDAQFSRRMPNFTGAAFGGPVILEPDTAFTAWFSRTRTRDFIAEARAQGIRNLRAAIEGSSNDQGANALYEMEMRCRRREMPRSRWAERAILDLYRLGAGYGVRPVRAAVGWLAVTCAIFALLVAFGFEPAGGAAAPTAQRAPLAISRGDAAACPMSNRPYGDAAIIAVRAAIPGFDAGEECLTQGGRWTVTVGRVAAVVLLGFFALGVRAQVKRG